MAWRGLQTHFAESRKAYQDRPVQLEALRAREFDAVRCPCLPVHDIPNTRGETAYAPLVAQFHRPRRDWFVGPQANAPFEAMTG